MEFLDYSMSLEQEKILSSNFHMVWEQLAHVKSICQDDYSMLASLDKAPAGDMRAQFEDEEDALRVADMFYNMVLGLKKPSHQDGLLYTLTWLRVVLSEDSTRGAHFYNLNKEPLKPFIDVCYKQNFSEEKIEKIHADSVVCASFILRQCPASGIINREKQLSVLKAFLLNKLKIASRSERVPENILQSWTLALKNCLACEDMLEEVCTDSVDPIADIMFKFLNNNLQYQQVLYSSGFALMLISLKAQYRQNLVHANLCKTIISIIAQSNKEKVKRIYLQVIECLLGQDNFSEMCVLYGFFPLLERLAEDKYKDEDVPELIDLLITRLRPEVKVLSSIERFETELKTQNLVFGPVHTERFWKKNFMYFERNEFDLIKKLIALLQSEDDETKSVAAFDIGEFARLHPEGRRMVRVFGATNDLFLLLAAEDISEDVKRNVLLATQKILVQNWANMD